MFGASRYNYDHFRRELLEKDSAKSRFESAPEAGDRAPDFELRTLDGAKVHLSDFEGDRNVVLTFGSATCPFTAGSIAGLIELSEEFTNDDIEFLFVYVREAHPGEELPAHRSMEDKVRAAKLFREEENVPFAILVDELAGKVHRKYGAMPNSTFLIDKSGRVAFRALATRPAVLGEAIEELLERQQQRGVEHAVVHGGEDRTLPSLRSFVHAYRALERGGESAIENFHEEMGLPGRVKLMGSRIAAPMAEHPKATIATAAAVCGVLGLGIWTGVALRRRRFENRDPYDYPKPARRRASEDEVDDYDAMGI